MPKDLNSETKWWKKTVIYQLYPRSFYDSNNDGNLDKHYEYDIYEEKK